MLLQCLTFDSPDDTSSLRMSIGNVCNFRVVPFEVIAGTPRERYGARMTFRATGPNAELAAAFGLQNHPWGDPDWVGFRFGRGGARKVKAYHRLKDVSRFRLPSGLPAPLYPVMAALHEDFTEVYSALWRPQFVDRVRSAMLRNSGGSKTNVLTASPAR